MKAIVLRSYGTQDSLALEEVERPVPADDDVLVRVRATSINDWDASLIAGTPIYIKIIHGWRRPNVTIPGCDVAGVVEAVGEGVERFRPGDAVYGDLHTCGFGTYAEFVCAKEANLEPKPEALSFEQAAALPHSATLAWQALHDEGELESARTLLINGAGGGVGPIALQLAKLQGLEVTGVDNELKLDGLLEAGCDHVLDYREQDFTRTGQAYDLVLDVKSTRSTRDYARALAPNGRYVTLGGTPMGLFRFLSMSRWTAWRQKKRLRMVGLIANKGLAEMAELFESSRVAPIVDGPYPLADVAEAMRRFARGEQLGRIVLTCGD